METAENNTGRVRPLHKPNNIIEIKASSDGKIGTGFFRKWLVFLRPLIDLTNREIDVVSCFLKQRWELSKSIADPKILDSVVMSEDTRKKVIKECGITLQHFYVVMSNLKKNGAIVNGTINPRLIPNLRKADNGVFQLLILFTGK